MNRLTPEKRAAVVAALVEGNSIRATCRMTGVAKNTVTKLLVDLGTACSVAQDRLLRDLPCQRIECDEIWAFVYAKERNVPVERRGDPGVGDVWTWVGMDADTKLVVSYLVGSRDMQTCGLFMHDLASRLRDRVQLTSDGHRPYLKAVRDAFGTEIDYAQIVKLYGFEAKGDTRYSPGVCIGAEKHVGIGNPDPDKISTSYIERQNLTMRMSIRRFTRLTNAFSKKVENLAAAVSLHFAYYNLCRPHGSLGKGTTPAMAAGVTDHVWTLPELIGLLEEAESVTVKRGPYKKTRAKRQYPGGQISA